MRKRILGILVAISIGGLAHAQEPAPWLHDRGSGIPTSMFGIYVEKGQLLVYPFLEYYSDKDLEYKPSDFGSATAIDYRGRYRAFEKLLFVSYGFSDRLAAEFEVSAITARLEKSPQDTSDLPARVRESGLGDVEGQVRYRWNRETASRPELYSWAEVVLPHDKKKGLIGTAQFETTFGTGAIKGFRFGTVTVNGWIGRSEGSFDPGMSIEYLRKLSARFSAYTGIEANQDEVEWIAELQIQLTRRARLKLNNSFGLTSKATDWGPEIGIVFSF